MASTAQGGFETASCGSRAFDTSCGARVFDASCGSRVFDAALKFVLEAEGDFSADARDPGNWTGGEVHKGELRGTCFGISAAAFPTLDIVHLTRAQAAAIYRHLYWDALALDTLPPRLAMALFDAAVNSGCAGAVRLLQRALGVADDGLLGTATMKALRARLAAEGDGALFVDLLVLRVGLMASLPGWRAYGAGWARRLFSLVFAAGAIPASA